jgi:hypothetical protein
MLGYVISLLNFGLNINLLSNYYVYVEQVGSCLLKMDQLVLFLLSLKMWKA